MLLDLRTRTVHEPAGLEELADEDRTGNFSFSVDWHDARTVRSIALNWRTGESYRNTPQGTRVVPDANRPWLTRKLCEPLRRRVRSTPVFEDTTPPFSTSSTRGHLASRRSSASGRTS